MFLGGKISQGVILTYQASDFRGFPFFVRKTVCVIANCTIYRLFLLKRQ
jgi:hypothetical protein